ncbi:MAG TPA: DJ-1/PfpI family protein [Vicinamibacterales bacterium]|nr:DJ-1/PfpI family protein [Vicinamibacterales bacterium]
MPTQILIITGDAGESYECLYARHRMLEAGITPRVAAPSRRRLHLVIHDFEPGWDTYIERRGYGAEADLTFADVRTDDYDAVLVLGGRAPEYLRHDPRVIDIVRRFDAEGKWIFAICHGVQVLAAAGLVKGRRVTAYENCRWEIEAAGATYVATDQAVRDGRIVTGQTWQSHPEFYRLVFDCLRSGTAVRGAEVQAR